MYRIPSVELTFFTLGYNRDTFEYVPSLGGKHYNTLLRQIKIITTVLYIPTKLVCDVARHRT